MIVREEEEEVVLVVKGLLWAPRWVMLLYEREQRSGELLQIIEAFRG